MTWSKAQRTAKNTAPGFPLPNLEILALGVLVVSPTFCLFPTPSCRTASLRVGKVGWHQSGLSFLREGKLESRVTTKQIGLMLPPEPAAPSGTWTGLAGPGFWQYQNPLLAQWPAVKKAAAWDTTGPTCPGLRSVESVGSDLKYCGVSPQGAQGWKHQKRWSENITTRGVLRTLSSCDWADCYFKKKLPFRIFFFHCSGASSCRHTRCYKRKDWKKFEEKRLEMCRLHHHQFTDLLSPINKDFILPLRKYVGFSLTVCVCLPFTMGLLEEKIINTGWNMEELPKTGKIPVCYWNKVWELL